ncbi:MAG: DNA polymerase I [Deltaproteobacteria bacterium]|nr:DNA polymerase I [Deltaproteobacteria bacterium]
MSTVKARTDAKSLGGQDALFVVDGSAFIFRAYHAIRRLTNRAGVSTNAAFGFTAMLLKIAKEYEPGHLAVAFDPPGGSFRNREYAPYKAHRPPPPDDLIPQFGFCREIVEAFNIASLEVAGFEADDVIATVTREATARGLRVVIVSGDKDLMQLVGERVVMLDTMKDAVIGVDEVKARFAVDPEHVVDVLALAGDSSDNIPGVPGIGEKTAGPLIAEFGDLESLLAQAAKVKGKRGEMLRAHADDARLSKHLATLRYDVQLSCAFDALARREPDRAKLVELLRRLDFTRLIVELGLPGASGASASIGASQVSRDNYKCVLTELDFAQLLARLDASPAFAVDTETTSLSVLDADIVGISLAVAPGEAYYIPVAHAYDGAPLQLARESVVERLRPLLESPRHAKIGQNMKFDAGIFARAGVRLAPLSFDTMIASYLLNPEGRSYKLDDLAIEHLGHKMIAFSEVAPDGEFAKVSVERATEYSAEDADVAFMLRDVFTPKLDEGGLRKLFDEIEMPVVGVIGRMERTGVVLDVPRLAAIDAEFAAMEDASLRRIRDIAGAEFNPASPKQLAKILFEELKLPVIKRTKTGPSTDVEVLEALEKSHPLPKEILEYRMIAKVRSTYLTTLPTLVHARTGRIHTSFNQTIAATGRLSSVEPNLQNIPIRRELSRPIREAFVAPPGNLLLSADYSQIELRLLAHMSADAVLIDAYQKDEDIHARTAAEVMGVMPGLVTAEMRSEAKAINFGIVYGISAFRLGRHLGIPTGRAADYIDGYFKRYAGVRRFIDETIAAARERGYVTTMFGRRRFLPDLKARNRSLQMNAERIAVNTPLQGSAADLIKLAMVRIDARLNREQLASRMILQVHDELVFEVPERERETVEALVKDEMEGAAALKVPLRVSIGVGRTWADVH